jgi:hypothetical protein
MASDRYYSNIVIMPKLMWIESWICVRRLVSLGALTTVVIVVLPPSIQNAVNFDSGEPTC